MNIEHIKILAWEHYRRCLKTVFPTTLVFVALLISAFILDRHFVRSLNYQSNVDEIGIGFTMLALAVVGLMVLISNTSNRELDFSMGKYYLRLPIKAWHLAAIRITLNLITLIGVIFIMGSISLYYYNVNHAEPISWLTVMTDFELINVTFFMVLFLYLVIQVMAWTFSTPSLFVGCFVVWCIIAKYQHWFFENYVFVIGTGIGYFVCIGLGGRSLRYARSDEPLPFTLAIRSVVSDLLALVSPRSDRSTQPFNSPKEAQYWLERRSMLNAYKNATALFLLLFISLMSFIYMTSRGLDMFTDILFSCAVMSIVITMIIVGICNGISTYRRQTTSLKDFMFTKPISSRQIARSRTKALLSIVWFPCVLFLGIGLYYCFICFVEYDRLAALHDSRYLAVSPKWDYPEWARIFTIEAIGFYIVLLCAVWCLSWMMHSIPSTLLLWCLFFLAQLIGEGIRVYSYPFGIPMLGVLIAIVPILYIWVYSYKRKLLMVSPKVLWLFPLLMACILLPLIENFSWHEEDYAGALFVAALVFFPIASAPASIHVARHR